MGTSRQKKATWQPVSPSNFKHQSPQTSFFALQFAQHLTRDDCTGEKPPNSSLLRTVGSVQQLRTEISACPYTRLIKSCKL